MDNAKARLVFTLQLIAALFTGVTPLIAALTGFYLVLRFDDPGAAMDYAHGYAEGAREFAGAQELCVPAEVGGAMQLRDGAIVSCRWEHSRGVCGVGLSEHDEGWLSARADFREEPPPGMPGDGVQVTPYELLQLSELGLRRDQLAAVVLELYKNSDREPRRALLHATDDELLWWVNSARPLTYWDDGGRFVMFEHGGRRAVFDRERDALFETYFYY